MIRRIENDWDFPNLPHDDTDQSHNDFVHDDEEVQHKTTLFAHTRNAQTKCDRKDHQT